MKWFLLGLRVVASWLSQPSSGVVLVWFKLTGIVEESSDVVWV